MTTEYQSESGGGSDNEDSDLQKLHPKRPEYGWEILLDRRGLQPHISPQMFRQIIHGFDALGKDHNAVTRIFGVPSVGIATQKFQQFLIAREVFGRDLSQSSMQLF